MGYLNIHLQLIHTSLCAYKIKGDLTVIRRVVVCPIVIELSAQGIKEVMKISQTTNVW